MAGINKENFGGICPLVRKYGFKVTTSDGKMLIINPTLKEVAFDVSKDTTRWEGIKKQTKKDFAWNIRANVCANAMNGCPFFDHNKENSMQTGQQVNRGMCMPTVVNNDSMVTLEVELSS